MQYITNAFRYVLGFSNKKEITGHIMAEDKETNQTLLMIKEGEHYWYFQWIDNDEYSIKPVEYSMKTVFAVKE